MVSISRRNFISSRLLWRVLAVAQKHPTPDIEDGYIIEKIHIG